MLDSGDSMPKETLSKRGARNTKLTVQIPAGLNEDLKALRESTFQSTGDLVNTLLEQVVEAQADAVREGRRLLEIEQERKEKAKRNAVGLKVETEAPDRGKRRKESESSIPSPTRERSETVSEAPDRPEREQSTESRQETATRPRFTESDIIAWSMESGSVTTQRKRRSEGRKFLDWLIQEGRSGTPQDAEDYAPLVRARYDNEATARNVVAVPRGLVKWWGERPLD